MASVWPSVRHPFLPTTRKLLRSGTLADSADGISVVIEQLAGGSPDVRKAMSTEKCDMPFIGRHSHLVPVKSIYCRPLCYKFRSIQD